ncbi:hypothetical protein [Thermogemmatispora sp.]|uniref:hypothetical protein n=1 Tax=Thermogemmatispora sp. TaxID=1968838 RepID=UPI0035E46509
MSRRLREELQEQVECNQPLEEHPGGKGTSATWRGRYRQVVSVLIIPLGMIISLRALWLGWQAWTLMLLGLAFVSLGLVRLQLLPPWHLAHARQRKGGGR